jgi:phosphatidylethanolamine/phosphatidyl-N-methylethanolamine N-methyltransferase
MGESRQRPGDDPDAIVRDWYANHYSSLSASADGSGFARYMHHSMEGRYERGGSFSRVLEVGGNRGEHVPFVRHSFDVYVLSDLCPASSLVDPNPRVTACTCDVTDLPFPAETFDRVIATCLMHHVVSPFRAAQELRRVTRPGGAITVLVPTDPGLAYRIGKAVTSGRAARRGGVYEQHRLVAALDHRNHFLSIKTQLEHVFRGDLVSAEWFPWRLPVMSVNAFVVFHVTKAVS